MTTTTTTTTNEKIPRFSWSPTELVISQHTSITSEHKIEIVQEPLPEDGGTYNYDNGVALRFEAEACRQAIADGKIEHPYVTHDMSRLIMHIMDETRNQLNKSNAHDDATENQYVMI